MLQTHRTIHHQPSPGPAPVLVALPEPVPEPSPAIVEEAARAALFGLGAAREPLPDRERRALADAMVRLVSLRNRAPVGCAARSPHLHLLIDGWAYRAHSLLSGTRQIVDLFVPGDICDWAPPAPHEEIRACGPARVAVLRRDVLERELPAFRRCREDALDGELGRLRARLTSLGRRNACERVAHLLTDLHARLARVGLATGGAFACPLTQEQLGDTLGLTSVHINRVLQLLRADGLLMVRRGYVVLTDVTRLRDLAQWEGDAGATHGAESGLADRFARAPAGPRLAC